MLFFCVVDMDRHGGPICINGDVGTGAVPFRFDRPLSSGSQLSRFGCACRVSTLPLFSAGVGRPSLHCTERFGRGYSFKDQRVKTPSFFYLVRNEAGFVSFRCTVQFCMSDSFKDRGLKNPPRFSIWQGVGKGRFGLYLLLDAH